MKFERYLDSFIVGSTYLPTTNRVPSSLEIMWWNEVCASKRLLSYTSYVFNDDVAMFFITVWEAWWSAYILVQALPTTLFTLTYLVLGECQVYGYGYKHPKIEETSEILSVGTMSIISLDACMARLGPYLAPGPWSGMMCALGAGVDACQVGTVVPGFKW